jgi:hypothetical protein
VERGEDAVPDARAAASDAGSASGARLVTLGRAFDRANLLDSAALAYQKAAARLPAIADWLRLRAAGLIADSARRAELYADVKLPAAVPRIRWTEALARERTGDALAAAAQYESLGATMSAVRLRLAGNPDSVSRAGIRRALLAVVTGRGSADDAREAIGILDRSFVRSAAPKRWRSPGARLPIFPAVRSRAFPGSVRSPMPIGWRTEWRWPGWGATRMRWPCSTR